jgi:Transposase DDE domain group 1
MHQEVDIRYIVTSLEGSAQHLHENVYCQRGQMENLIKLHKAQLASDRVSYSTQTVSGLYVPAGANPRMVSTKTLNVGLKPRNHPISLFDGVSCARPFRSSSAMNTYRTATFR